MAPAKKKLKQVATKKKKAAKKKKAVVKVTGSSELNIKALQIHCNGTCTADPLPRHVKSGDLIVIYTTNTGVTLTFQAGSPFISGNLQIILGQGEMDFEIVADGIAHGTHFPFTLVCTKALCANLQAPPDMIVD